MQWAPDGSAFYVQTNEREREGVRHLPIRLEDATRARCSMRTKEGTSRRRFRTTASGCRSSKVITTNDTDVYVWSAAIEADHPRLAASGPGDVLGQPGLIHRPLTCITLTNDAGEFARLRRYALVGGQQEDVEKADWDIVEQRVLAWRVSIGRRS